MHSPSIEQIEVLNNINTNNIQLDSVAGSGKTTTNIFIASTYKNWNILTITYNRKLCDETKNKFIKCNIQNNEIHTYHSLCSKYYCSAPTDKGLIKSLDLNRREKKKYDLIILDEVQDMTDIIYKFICHFLKDLDNEFRLLIMGDYDQCIYGFKDADSRYLVLCDKIFKYNKYPWMKLKLSQSFRITKPMANFLNNCVLERDKLISTKDGVIPQYIIGNAYYKPYQIISKLLLKYKQDDIFILAPSVKASKGKNETPITRLSNKLSDAGINIFMPDNDDQKIDESIIKNKLTFLSFHQCKGLERKIVFVYGFDSSYFKYFDRDIDKTKCPNTLYVALTRALKELYIFHSDRENYCDFVRHDILGKYVNVIGKIDSIIPFEKALPRTIPVTCLISFLPVTLVYDLIKKYTTIDEICEITNIIDIPIKKEKITNNKIIIENVADITGTFIPSYYQYSIHNNLTILNNVKASSFFDKNNIDEFIIKLDEFEYTKENILKLSNYHNSMENLVIFKTRQIDTYDWVSDDNLTKSMKRLAKHIGKDDLLFEVPISKLNCIYVKNEQRYDSLSAYIDIINGNKIYELKFVNELKDEHILQVCLYAYLYYTEYKAADCPEFYLYNIRNNNKLRINITKKQSIELFNTIIDFRNSSNKYISNEEFIERCMSEIKVETKENELEIIGSNAELFIEKYYKHIKKYLDLKKEYDNKQNLFYFALKYIEIDDVIVSDKLIVDIETNANKNILQVAYKMYTNDMILIYEKNIYINDGVNYVFFYPNITKEELIRIGLKPEVAFNIICNDLNNTGTIIGHNVISFDLKYLNMNFNKYNLNLKNDNVYDTMLVSKNIVNAKDKNGRIKYPKLKELYMFLCNKEVDENEHTALYDVEITYKCYVKLIS